MVSSLRRTISVASPTATIAGTMRVSVPVISATISMTASGAREMLPKHDIIPTMTYGAGSWPRLGTMGSNRRQTAAPMNAPITMPGPKMPPEPPEPMESPVVTMRANGKRSTIQSGMCRSWRPEALLYPSVAGPEHLGDGQCDAADDQAPERRPDPARDGKATEEVCDAVETLGVQQPDQTRRGCR